MPEKPHPPARLSWGVWGLGALFYLIAFYQRVTPAVMTRELMAEFAIGGALLGNLSAFYFYSYVAMQVPTGLLADAWGPRRLLTAGALVAGLGALVFGLAPNIYWAYAGRLAIGGSVAVAFVVLLKLIAHWLPPRVFAMASGLNLFVGLIGAVGAGAPLRFLVDHFGWRLSTIASGVFTLLLAVVIWVFVRDDPAERGYQSHAPAGAAGKRPAGPLQGLKRVFGYRNTWFLFFAPAGVVGPILAFAGLWGAPFITARYGTTIAQSAAVCSALLMAWGLGGPILGGLSDRLARRKAVYLWGNIAAAAGWLTLVLASNLPLWGFVLVALLTGFASGGMIVGFAFAKESTPAHLTGAVSGVTNMGVMIGPMVLQPVIGWLLDLKWRGVVVDGARVYHPETYQSAFVLLPAWAILACILVAMTRETAGVQTQ